MYVAVLRLFDPVGLRDIGARRVAAEQFVRLGLVGGDRRHRGVGIVETARIALDTEIDAAEPEIERTPAHHLARHLDEIFWIERPDRLDRETGPAVAAIFQPQQAAFQW